ncbi:MAG: hypothetical protein ACNYPG_05615 [Candidatus Porifericomitaceae bacterium WSBS_2022_MAG_OTU9]
MAASVPKAIDFGSAQRRKPNPAQMPYSSLTLVVATRAEAEPLCRYYRLRHIAKNLWQGSGSNDGLRLLLTGIGGGNAASAVHGNPSNQGAWLNVGIAWHHYLEPGTTVLAHSIYNGKCNWFPQIVFTPPCPCDNLTSVAEPKPNYQHQGLVDMEAAGFYGIALKTSSLERVHCLKVVSDNPGKGLTNTAARHLAPSLIHNAMPVIDVVRSELLRINSILARREPAIDLQLVLARYGHATVSEQTELRLRLRQWHHLFPKQPLPPAPTASKLLATLRQSMRQAMQP